MDIDIIWNEEEATEIEALNDIFGLQEVKSYEYQKHY